MQVKLNGWNDGKNKGKRKKEGRKNVAKEQRQNN